MAAVESNVVPFWPDLRMLDAVAYASRLALGAREVLIAAGSDDSWSIRGFSRVGRERSLRGVVVSLPRDLPQDRVLPVTLESGPQGGLALETAKDPPRKVEAVPDRLAAATRAADGLGVLMVVDQPEGGDRAGVGEGLLDLLEVVKDALAAETVSHRERLRAGLHEREEERHRWARELHDDTLQQLGALQVLLTAARRKALQNGPATEATLSAAVDTATALLAEQLVGLRHLITELRPAALDELGLRSPLLALAERTEGLSNVRVDMHVHVRYADGEVSTRLLPDIELAVYRVVQEALANAARHSRGSRVVVSVEESDDEVCVQISDDGQGVGSASGFGISGMKERAALAGGTLEVLDRAGQGGASGGTDSMGTVVRMVVPALHCASAEPGVGEARVRTCGAP